MTSLVHGPCAARNCSRFARLFLYFCTFALLCLSSSQCQSCGFGGGEVVEGRGDTEIAAEQIGSRLASATAILAAYRRMQRCRG
ncbi:hypothetical protein GQ42DRAFT_62522 [Ramicandelaber brevisporus]|nr:hypothetical protein GQ42DRAFT_62522 [Ramicandelaber brevisporus]